MKGHYIKRIGLVAFAVTLTLQITGCQYFTSPTAIKTFAKEEQVETFYGERVGVEYIDNEAVQRYDIKEWKGQGKKYRCESTSLIQKKFFEENSMEKITDGMLRGDMVEIKEIDIFDEKQLMVYLPYKDEYWIKDMSLAAEVSDNVRIGIGNTLKFGSLKDYVMDLITELEKDYTLSIEDDIRVNNCLTQHIIAVAKDKNKTDRCEFWIDQSTWLVVKQIVCIGNYTQELEYTKFEVNPTIDESLFIKDISKEANVKYINNNLEEVNKEITLDEASHYLHTTIFYVEEDYARLEAIHYIENINAQYGQIEITYKTNEGDEFVVLNTIAAPVNKQLQLSCDRLEVRGIEATYEENGGIKAIEFIDGTTICVVYTKNSDMNKDELIAITNQLKTK